MIIKDKNICGGNPIIKGTRITVAVVLANVRDGIPFAEICDDYHITKQDITDCFDYVIKKVE